MQDPRAPSTGEGKLRANREAGPDAVPYAGRGAEPGEQVTRPDWQQVESRSPETLIAEAPAGLAPLPPNPVPGEPSGEVGASARWAGEGFDAQPDPNGVVAEAAGPNNSWGATVRQEGKYSADLLPDGAQREPPSPGVGPLPRHLVVPLALIVLIAIAYVLAQSVF